MSGEVQPRKRKDKRKGKKGDEGFKAEEYQEKSSVNDDSDEKNHDDSSHDHHHGSNGGVLAKLVFFVLFAGLLVAVGTVFFQLKGSEIADTPIKESRYASILENFVDEHPPDDHEEELHPVEDDHDDEDEHDKDEAHEDEEHGEEESHDEDEDEEHHESSVQDAEASQPETEEKSEAPSEKVIEDIHLEPSIPEEVTLPPSEVEANEISEDDDDEANEIPEEEQSVQFDEPSVDEPSVVEEPTQQKTEDEPSQIETEQADEVSSPLEEEQHPEEAIPTLIKEGDYSKSYKMDDDVQNDDEPEKSQVSEDEEKNVDADEVDGLFEGIFDGIFGATDDKDDEASHDEEDEEESVNILVSDAAPELAASFDYNADEDDKIDTSEHTETKHDYTKIIDDVLKEQEGQPDRNSYPAAGITNDYDFEFHEELDEAQRLIHEAPDKAQQVFTNILQKHPLSPRAVYGKALAIDRLSEMHRSNALLEQSIYMYRDVLDLENVPNDLYMLAGLRCVDRMRFRGYQLKALRVLKRMKERFPNNAEIGNQMAVTYLLMSQNDNAKTALEEVLKSHPNNGFAKVHYGFVIKTADKEYEKAIKYLNEGISTEEPGTIDGRFYFHLGDAYTRTGKPEKALEVYEKGVQRGLFLSAYQRSLYNVNSLTARPWWTTEQSTYDHYFRILEKHWKTIRDEAVPLLSDVDQGYFPENEGLKKKGTWKQFELFARGEKIDVNCNRAPKTCTLIANMAEAAECKRGQVKFSVLLPGTHVWPHTGPTNCRLRSHLGLVVPEGARIRVANETRQWEEGKVLVFDDSFEHEVWHDGQTYRLVLIVDFWHPDLTTSQKQMLSPI